MQKELASWCAEHPSSSIGNYAIFPDQLESGIIFIFASWSPTIVQLKALLQSLADSPGIPLYVYDIDAAGDFMERNGLRSDGWGETFWIKNGSVIATLKKYSSNDLAELIRNNNLLF